MTPPDPVLARVAEGVELRRQGRHAEARVVLERLWAEVGGESGDPLHRCAIAHALADAQDDVHDELRWDLAALDAAHAVTDAETDAAGMLAASAALFPSLHLNLAECYRRTGDVDEARDHVNEGLRATAALPPGEYAETMRTALRGLEERLGR